MKNILETISELIEIPVEYLTDDFDLNKSIFWDSLTKISLIGVFKSDFNKTITSNEIDKIVSIKDLKFFIGEEFL